MPFSFISLSAKKPKFAAGNNVLNFVATVAKFPASKQQTIKTLLPVSAVATANPVRTPSQNKISFGSLAASLQHSK